MPKEKVNYQKVYDLNQLCSETKDLKFLLRVWCQLLQVYELKLELVFKVQKLTPDQIKVRRERRSKTIVSKETYDKRQLLTCYIKI